MHKKQRKTVCLRPAPATSLLQENRRLLGLPECELAHICMARMKEGKEISPCEDEGCCRPWVELLLL